MFGVCVRILFEHTHNSFGCFMVYLPILTSNDPCIQSRTSETTPANFFASGCLVSLVSTATFLKDQKFNLKLIATYCPVSQLNISHRNLTFQTKWVRQIRKCCKAVIEISFDHNIQVSIICIIWTRLD